MTIFGVTFPFYYAGADPLPMLCLVVVGRLCACMVGCCWQRTS
jgi:hypothetical protein